MKSWGYHLRINAAGMDHDKIRSREVIIEFLNALVAHIGMTKHGESWAERFGVDPKVSGFTFFQPILESCITGHLVEQNDSGYFDIFSCLPFDTGLTIKFIVDYFNIQAYTSDFSERQAPEISYVDNKYDDPRASD